MGRFSEFDQLRKVGVRYADVKGYAYSREDVRAKALANSYSASAIGDVFTRETEAAGGGDRWWSEVERSPTLAGHEENCDLPGAVRRQHQRSRGLLRHRGCSRRHDRPASQRVSGGSAPRAGSCDWVSKALQRAGGEPNVDPDNLEACVLERGRPDRKFRRLTLNGLNELLGS